MALETGSYIADLVITNPDGGDQKSTADDHLRLIKKCVTQSFPNIAGEVSASHGALNYVVGVTSSIQTQLDTISASLVALSSTLATAITDLSATLNASKLGISATAADSMLLQGQEIYGASIDLSGTSIALPPGWSSRRVGDSYHIAHELSLTSTLNLIDVGTTTNFAANNIKREADTSNTYVYSIVNTAGSTLSGAAKIMFIRIKQ